MRIGETIREAEWQAVARRVAGILPANQDGGEAAGKQVFESTACLNCHAIAGTNGNGRFGPNLTHLMSRHTIAAGAAENTPENLRL